MSRIVHIRPVGGCRVLDPATNRPVAESGQRMELTAYWRRRLAAGEVEIVKTEEAGGEIKTAKRKE